MGCVEGKLMQHKPPKNTQQRLVSVLIINLVFASLLSVFCSLDLKTFATLYLIQEKKETCSFPKYVKSCFIDLPQMFQFFPHVIFPLTCNN